jgi:hypothetical protein
MARFNNNQESYKINLEINKEELLKDLKEIKNEVKSVTKEIDTDIKHIRMKRKDILLIKLNGRFKEADKKDIEKQLKKTLHRKVFVVDNLIEDIHVLEK